jgi:proteasome lid subunit RPN8/RPN11
LESSKSSGLWQAAECAVAIEYLPAVLEEIRLAVVKAFYAFPRGGAEIGGVLLGSHTEGKVVIAAHRELACEHLYGPSFTLSPKDLTALEATLAGAAAEGLQAVGWYHSHTRSEIFLSAQDVEVHERFFPEPWQIALVLRPGSMITRAGFFARGKDGGFRTEATYAEFVVPVLASRPMVQADRPAPEPPPVEPAGEPAPEPEPEVTPPEPPAFTARYAEPERALRIPWRLIGLVAVLATAAGLATATREYWAVYLLSDGVWLNAVDQDGTLQVRWNRGAKAVRRARAGTLEINDGPSRPVLPLPSHTLQTGSVSYQRQTERVELKLRLEQTGGTVVDEFVTFAGKLPARFTDPALQELRTDLIREKMLNEALQRELRKPAPRREEAPPNP